MWRSPAMAAIEPAHGPGFRSDAADGFNIMPPYLPGGLDDFIELVIPELHRRGLFRTEYEGRTLRENPGLPRPQNRRTARPQEDAPAHAVDFEHAVQAE